MNEIFSSVEFQMSLLLFTAIFGYLLASRIRQSVAVGEILVGLLVGPGLLGLITYTDFVRSVAGFGAIVLLFVVGLEFRPRDILNPRYALIAVCGIVVSFAGGLGVALLFGFNSISSVFVGTAITATSIAITANVFKEMNLLKSEVARAIVGAAVFDDVLGLLALSVTLQFAGGGFSYLSVGVIIVKAVLFFIVGLLVGNTVFRRIIVRIDDSRWIQRYPEFIFLFAIMVAFLYGIAAELAGLSAIVGSFIAGVSLGDIGLRHGKSYHEGGEYLRIIFSSVFFISLGILADFRVLTAGLLVFLFMLCLVAILAKLLGCFFSARFVGYSTRDSLIIGSGMCPRGEVAMIIGLVGLNSGIFGQQIYVPLVMMCVITTLVTPFFLRFFYTRELSSTVVQFRIEDRPRLRRGTEVVVKRVRNYVDNNPYKTILKDVKKRVNEWIERQRRQRRYSEFTSKSKK